MAVISELVRAIAEIEGLEENFVSVYARSAREAGFISHHGRGRNAARMVARDAANLIIGVNSSSLAKNVPETIREYSNLTLKIDQEYLIGSRTADHLGKKGTLFGDALTFLLDCDENGRPNSACILEEVRDPQFKQLKPEQRSSIRIEFDSPAPRARIKISSLKDVRPKRSPNFVINADLWYFRDQSKKLNIKHGDRNVSTSISANTLIAVAELLRT